VTDADLSALLNTHQQQMPLATIGVKHITDEEVSQMAIVVTDQSGTDSESGYVQSFKEKPSLAEAEDSRLASIGFYVLSPDVYTEFVTWGKAQWEKSGEFDYAFDFFPTLLKAHPNEIYAFMIPQPFYWSDIGRPDQYIATVRDIYEDKLQLGQTLQPERYYENGIIFWENAKEQAVLENTILKGNLIVFNRRS
jgi:NDP-sugar pyrophosphorylase family protein